jgi:hypothetical protein
MCVCVYRGECSYVYEYLRLYCVSKFFSKKHIVIFRSSLWGEGTVRVRPLFLGKKSTHHEAGKLAPILSPNHSHGTDQRSWPKVPAEEARWLGEVLCVGESNSNWTSLSQSWRWRRCRARWSGHCRRPTAAHPRVRGTPVISLFLPNIDRVAKHCRAAHTQG